ncbi:MAG: formate--tetrahydrofolate ligase [Rhodospirillales bacterium]|jgi:formate--tetrahydrofolate ligase
MTDPSLALRPIAEIAAKLDIPADAIEPYGRTKAKIDPAWIATRAGGATGRLILVTAINPTPAGEGKTTTTIGLSDALTRLGRKTVICLREPSLGPCFGAKGGATGGGKAQIGPKEEIDLHFTGDFHAVTSAHNLLAAMIDNALHHGTAGDLDPRRVTWRRVMDMNDRTLRNVVAGLGGRANGVVRETGFDITTASEIMAILCLASDLADLKARLARIVIGWTADGRAVTADAVKAVGPMAALLKEAVKPNLVQSLEGTPAFVHGGPFANIAHGCSSVIATRAALSLADLVVTEAGFGADLGAEKFFDIKCRLAGLAPAAAVVVATVRALKFNGGVPVADLGREDLVSLERGLPNLLRHVENLRGFGVPVVVAINAFHTDTAAEHDLIRETCARAGVVAEVGRHFADGGVGAEGVARAVLAALDGPPATFAPLYPDDMALLDKIRTIATRIYRAADVSVAPAARTQAAALEAAGYGRLPVCIAKTQYSFSTDPKLLGAPTGHVAALRELRLSAGAGFVVALMGDVQTMPGLPKAPQAERIDIDADGGIVGLR